VESKWGKDIGCPDGVGVPFNIDAKINAAYVVMGLLYGEGNLDRTLEISTRCGQDSDCNPATAGAILGVMMGYSNIPEKWSKGLQYIEDMNFDFTDISLNKAYEISTRHALEIIERNGGRIEGEEVYIPKQIPKTVPLEQNFSGFKFLERRTIETEMTEGSAEMEFTGNGVVLTGKVGNADHRDTWILLSADETLNNYVMQVNIYIDGELTRTQDLPLYFITRNHELYYNYKIEPGDHQLKLEIVNPHPKAYLIIWDIITYEIEGV